MRGGEGRDIRAKVQGPIGDRDRETRLMPRIGFLPEISPQ